MLWWQLQIRRNKLGGHYKTEQMVDLIWHELIWIDMIWYDLISLTWFDMIWYDLIWFDMIDRVHCKCLCALLMMERAQWRPREKTYCSTWLAGEFKALKRWSSSDPHQRWPTPQRPFWSCLQETTFSSSPWCDDPSCRSRPTSQSWGQLSSASVVLHGACVVKQRWN